MKILSRVSLFVLGAAFSLFLTTGYAGAADDKASEKVLSLEEARALIDGLPTYSDATAGTVPAETGLSFYDIYSRQIAFRENTKAFRNSLEARRENYKNIYIDKQDAYKKNMEAIYKAEIAAYQKEMGAKEQSSKNTDNTKQAKFEMDVSDDESSEDSSEEDVVETEDDVGLKEEVIPPSDEEDQKVKKKVVTSDDAPDFDPGNLSDKDDDAGWDDTEHDVAEEEPMAGEEDVSVENQDSVEDEFEVEPLQ